MQSDRITELLDELHEATGVSLSYDKAATFADATKTISLLEEMLSSCKKRTAVSAFWSSLLEGKLTSDEITHGLSEYHLTEDAVCIVYLINLPGGLDESVYEILKDLTDEHDRTITVDDNNIVLLHMPRTNITNHKIDSYAATLADTLAADAMLRINIAYDGNLTKISDIEEAMHNSRLAMHIGLKFFSQNNIYSYHNLGLEKLVYKLSDEDCREFINDHMNGFTFDTLSSELSSSVHAFLDTGLSVAEASSRLFIHRNTLLYRLDKFQKLSGLDLRKFDDAVTAKIAMLMEMRLS